LEVEVEVLGHEMFLGGLIMGYMRWNGNRNRNEMGQIFALLGVLRLGILSLNRHGGDIYIGT
jgi:hypothetical protein